MLSVIMPVYNAEKYVKYSIDSILRQKFKQYELLIYDDASTDSSSKILREYSKKDSRLKVFYGKKNIKQPNALNYLIKKTNYNLIAFNDADDISHPDRFLKQVIYLSKNNEVGAVGTFANIINQNSKLLRKITYPANYKDIRKNIGKINCFAQSSMMIRKKFIIKAGLFRCIFDPAQDYDMWCRVSLLTKLSNIPEFLIDYREHMQSSSNLRREDSFFKSEFIKINYNYLKKKKDLLTKIKIKKINKALFYSKLKLNKKETNLIEMENTYSQITFLYKQKKFLKFTIGFFKLFFKKPKFLISKILFYLSKSSYKFI